MLFGSTQAIETPAGIFNSRSAFWLNEVKFDYRQRLLHFDASINAAVLKQAQDIDFSVQFHGVRSFECVDYDEFEARYGRLSQSNFDQLLIGSNHQSRYKHFLLWFYDHGFSITAQDYLVSNRAALRELAADI